SVKNDRLRRSSEERQRSQSWNEIESDDQLDQEERERGCEWPVPDRIEAAEGRATQSFVGERLIRTVEGGNPAAGAIGQRLQELLAVLRWLQFGGRRDRESG